VRVTHHDLKKFFDAVQEFMEPIEKFFLARYPAMVAATSAQTKQVNG